MEPRHEGCGRHGAQSPDMGSTDGAQPVRHPQIGAAGTLTAAARSRSGMGNRYLAYRVEPHFIGLARHDPGLFLPDEPPALALDDCWPSLQRLTMQGEDHRPSHRLFDAMRQDPWLRVLDPDEVERIAADIVLLGEHDVRARFSEEQVASVLDALGRTQHFLVDAARSGQGVVCLIG